MVAIFWTCYRLCFLFNHCMGGRCDMTEHNHTTQNQQSNSRWNGYNWNHMALPTFGFIFAVPEPPPDLQIPTHQQVATATSSPSNKTTLDQSSGVDDETSQPDSHQQSVTVSRLQSRRQRKSDSDKRSRQRSQPHIRPTAALQRGNSDPFSAAGITITPQINKILTFARDVCLPAFYFIDTLRDCSISTDHNRDVANSTGWISSPAARLGWQQVVDALSDQCTALACLSTYLALMAICDIDTTKSTEDSLKMRAGSSALLRQRLVRHHEQKTDTRAHRELLWQVFWHFYAEFFAGNMLAAQVHGKMLRQSCENAGPGIITDHFLDSVIFVDSHMAAKYMSRPVLDVDFWLPGVFASTWNRVDPHLAKLTGETGNGLHPYLEPSYLRAIFIRTRQTLILLRHSEDAKMSNIGHDTLYYWLNSHAYVDSGILIEAYLKIVEHAMNAPRTEPSLENSQAAVDSLGKTYTEASLCLSCLFTIRDIAGQEVLINSFDVVDASSTIVKHLKEIMEKALTHCTPEESSRYRALHLWCAFTGALIEQRQSTTKETHPSSPRHEPRKKLGGHGGRFTTRAKSEDGRAERSTRITSLDASNMHFNHLLARIAYSMGLLSWQQVSDELKKLIYSESSEPHPSRWFWKTTGAYLDGKRKEAMKQQETRRATENEAQPSSTQSHKPSSTVPESAPMPLRQLPPSETQIYSGDAKPLSTVSGTQNPDGTRRSSSMRLGQVSERTDRRRWTMQRTQSHGP